MRRILLGAAFTLVTAGAIAWVPLTFHLPLWIGAALLAGGVLLAAVAGSENRDETKLRGSLIVGGLALLVAAWLLDGPLQFAALLTAIGLLTHGIPQFKHVSFSARFVGEIALGQGLVAGLYTRFLANVHAATWLGPLDRLLGRAVGLNVSLSAGQTFVPGPEGAVAVTPTWDHLGLVFGLVILVGWFVWAGRGRVLRSGWRILGGIGLVGGLLIARRFGLLLVSIEIGRPDLFWDPTVTLLTMLPIAGALAALVPGGRTDSPILSARKSSRGFLVLGSSLLAGLLLLLGVSLAPAGPAVSGGVTFDEGHGDWESTLRPLDTESYGMSSTYNYASLYAWLAYYAPVDRLTGSIDAEALRETQVLVLKTPSILYSPSEIEAIASFVRAGGGLFVIGDHTNVFGSTTALNPILAVFGLSLRDDSTYDLHTGSFTTAERDRHASNPIGQHVERFEFLTSCTLKPSWRSLPILTDTRILANRADYGTRDFFPEDRFTHASVFGGATQATATTYGRGRVVVFTDSTCFSNFSMHMDGYPNFILATLGFLSRTAPPFPWRAALSAGGGLILLLTFGLAVVGRPTTVRPLLLGLVLAWAVAPPIAAAFHRAWYPLLDPISEVPHVFFETAQSQARISGQPSYDKGAMSQAFDTFFVATQRVGRVPVLVDGSAKNLPPDRMYVWIDPTPSIHTVLLDRIASFVASGGRLILMGRPGRDDAVLRAVAERLGHTLARSATGGWTLANGEIETREVSPSLTLKISTAQSGKGWFILVSDSSPFSNTSLGGAFAIPSPLQLELYRIAYGLLSDPIGERPDAMND